MKYSNLAATVAVALSVMLAAPAYADPDDSDGPSTTDEICGAFNMGVPPGEIMERLPQNDRRENYWRSRDETRDAIVSGECG